MNKFFAKTAVASLLLVGAGAALAEAPVADLTVTGKLAVPGCTVAQSAGGTYDFGSISPMLIKPTTNTALTSQTQTWTVSCDAQTFLSFQVIDNQAASSAGSVNTQFGLGNINGTGKIGFYTVSLSNPKVDSATGYVYTAAPGSSLVTGAATATVNKTQNQGWAASSGASAAQKAGQVFAVDMQVTPTLGSTTTMGGPLTTSVPLNGSLTINYSFGL